MEHVIVESISKHLEDNEAARNSQHGFVKRKPCLINLVSSYDKVDAGRAVNVKYLCFSEVSDPVFYDILISKLRKYSINETTVKWIHNWLDHCDQSSHQWLTVYLGGDTVGLARFLS